MSHLRTCKPPPTPLKSGGLKKWLWKVRSVLNRTGNIIEKILRFSFFELSSKIGVIFQKNDTKMVITRKIKIVEFWNLVLLSIQPIADILTKKNSKIQKSIFKIQFFFFFKFLKFTWKIGNRLIRKKNQFSDFSDFYFSSYGHLSVIFLKNHPNFRWFYFFYFDIFQILMKDRHSAE